jgi:hypothetical protein
VGIAYGTKGEACGIVEGSGTEGNPWKALFSTGSSININLK